MPDWLVDFFETPSGAQRLILEFRLVAGAVVAAALFAVTLGCDPEWLNRAGALLVVLSLGLTFTQFQYENRSDEILDKEGADARRRLIQKGLVGPAADEALHERAQEARSDQKDIRSLIFLNSLLIAAFGEVLHGFGGWLWEVVAR